MIKTLFDKLIKLWGASKLTKVIALVIFGASAGGIIGANMIPDNPETDSDEAENEAENESEKEND